MLAVGVPEGTDSVAVRRLDLNRSGPNTTLDTVGIDLRLGSLQDAAALVRGGDLVVVWPGEYAGFRLENPGATGPGKFIRWTALGEPGQVKITKPGAATPDWMIALSNARYVVLDGFEIVGQNKPGQARKDTARAGVFIDGDFRHSGALAHHVAIVGCNIHGHRKWGLHSTDSHTVLIQDSYFGSSGEEHGCYVSDGSDRYVIRRNVFANNPISGLQCNLDPDSALEELNEHPKMKLDHDSTRAWASKALERGEKLFGPEQFPDGKGTHFIIEQNVAYANGAEGGAAFNLAALSQSVIQNNLLYGNLAAGIAQWDNDNSFDYDYHDPGPSTASQVEGPESLPLFGCQQNVIANNTVFMAVPDRVAVQSAHGSWGTRLYNNVLINQRGPAIEIDNTSIYRFEADSNLHTGVHWAGEASALAQLAKHLPSPATTASAQVLQAQFLRPGSGSWRDRTGWLDAGSRPDFRPTPKSSLLMGGATPTYLPARDLLGRSRARRTLGALEP